MFRAKNGKTKNQAARARKSLIGALAPVSIRRGKLPLLIIFCWTIFVVSALYFPTANASPAAADFSETATQAAPLAEFDSAEFDSEEFDPEGGAQQFSRFSHTNAAHRSVSCLMCHQRTDNSPRIKRPGHSPCIGCHAPQFSDPGNSQICLVCHTQIASSQLKAFPPLRSFNAKFNHVVHNRRGAAPREGCATCHRPSQGGVARSIPAGQNAHATCFQCHTNRAQIGGRDISSCGVCHSLGRLTRTSESARAFRLGFSHAEHTATRCAECHQVRAGARGNQVSATTPAMHFPPARAQSCASCHNNRRAFGGNDFSDCRRCHTNNFGL